MVWSSTASSLFALPVCRKPSVGLMSQRRSLGAAWVTALAEQIRSDLSLSHTGCFRALARTFVARARFASLLCGEGKLELTESAREFQKVSAPQSRLARSGGEEATGPDTPDLFFLRLQHLLSLLEHSIDRL